MSVEHGPSSPARSQCDGCGTLCLDEELAAALDCMPDKAHCADCYLEIRAAVLADIDEETQGEADALAKCDARNADRSREYEPRSAF